MSIESLLEKGRAAIKEEREKALSEERERIALQDANTELIKNLALDLLPEELREYARVDVEGRTITIIIPGFALPSRLIYINTNYPQLPEKTTSVEWFDAHAEKPKYWCVYKWVAYEGEVDLLEVENNIQDIEEALARAEEIGDTSEEAKKLAEKQLAAWSRMAAEKMVDDETLEMQFTLVSDGLRAARVSLYSATERVINSKSIIERAKNAAILENKFDGKNEEIRKAQAHEFLKDMYVELEAAEVAEREARLIFEQAQTSLELLKYRLRCQELAEEG